MLRLIVAILLVGCSPAPGSTDAGARDATAIADVRNAPDVPASMRDAPGDTAVGGDAMPDAPAFDGVLAGRLVSAPDRATLPVQCAVRLYRPGSVDLEVPDLFVEPTDQRTLTLAEFPMPWFYDGLEPGTSFHVGVLCDRDDDDRFDNIGGWYRDGTGSVGTVTVPDRELEVAVGLFRL